MVEKLKNLRHHQEIFEETYLSPRAAKSSASKGRQKPEEPCKIRTEFQKDRHRIIHSKSFRRLRHKTQVFISTSGDHYRTRLTHTLEVAEISRTIARALRLNEDLTEAIALGHDLGHTPFGHAGEAILNTLVPGGFKHNEQSERVVTKLEKLNLTTETLDGIRNHSGRAKTPITLEGQIVKIADRIAYLNHDIDDAVRAGLIEESDIPGKVVAPLGETCSDRILTMMSNLIENSYDKDSIQFTPEIAEATLTLRSWMFGFVYDVSNKLIEENKKAERVIGELFCYYAENPQKNPYFLKEENADEKRAAADYIAGMTDNYALSLYSSLFLPNLETVI